MTRIDVPAVTESFPHREYWKDISDTHNLNLYITIDDQITRVIVSKFKRISQLKHLINCEGELIYIHKGRLLNRNKLICDEQLKNNDMLHVLAENPDDPVNPKKRGDWTNISNIDVVDQVHLFQIPMDSITIMRIIDIRHKNDNKRELRYMRRLVSNFDININTEPDTLDGDKTDTVLESMNELMQPSKDPLPIFWNQFENLDD